MIYCISLKNYFLLNLDIDNAVVGAHFLCSPKYTLKMLKNLLEFVSVEFLKNGADQQLSDSWKL